MPTLPGDDGLGTVDLRRDAGHRHGHVFACSVRAKDRGAADLSAAWCHWQREDTGLY